tara:strand:- start:2194 stop:2616 length:423 start_codon:yes stop_codon:yes gene_type:complete
MLNSAKEFISNRINRTNRTNMFMIMGALLIITFVLFFITGKATNKIKGGQKQEAMFVLYYVDWCPHCKVVKPEWEKLENDTSIKNIAITKVNCEKDEKAAEENNIEGFPTILFTHNNKVEAYEGGREYEDFKKFLMSKNL